MVARTRLIVTFIRYIAGLVQSTDITLNNKQFLVAMVSAYFTDCPLSSAIKCRLISNKCHTSINTLKFEFI